MDNSDSDDNDKIKLPETPMLTSYSNIETTQIKVSSPIFYSFVTDYFRYKYKDNLIKNICLPETSVNEFDIYLEEERINAFIDNQNINTNYFNYSNNKEGIEVEWHTKCKKIIHFNIDEQYKNNLKYCISNKNKNIIIIPIITRNEDYNNIDHEIICIYNKHEKDKLQLFDNENTDNQISDLNKEILTEIKKVFFNDLDIKLITVNDFHSDAPSCQKGWFFTDNENGDWGWCQLWSLWFIHLIILNQDLLGKKTIKEIYISAINKINDDNEYIKKYTYFFINIVEKILQEINNTNTVKKIKQNIYDNPDYNNNNNNNDSFDYNTCINSNNKRLKVNNMGL